MNVGSGEVGEDACHVDGDECAAHFSFPCCVQGSELQLLKQNEELQMQVAELSILARIKQSEGSEAGSGAQDSEAVLEKYWETKRELETLRQHLSTDYEDKAERLNTAKKNLEKKVSLPCLTLLTKVLSCYQQEELLPPCPRM